MLAIGLPGGAGVADIKVPPRASSSPAGILAFRALTFWLPTVPGVPAFHEVQRRRRV